MKISVIAIALFTFVLISCGNEVAKENKEPQKKQDSIVATDSSKAEIVETPFTPCVNDSLNELMSLIAGINKADNSKILNSFFKSGQFKSFSDNFEKKWFAYDSSRVKKLVEFRNNEITKNVGTTKKLFYPFSGPDILYGYTFFPDADEYIMMGLEPVGTLPIYDEKGITADSMDRYYKKVNTSLHAILKYSFFRTKSMKEDLKNQDLDGTLHLLFLFLARTGNSICSAKPITLDSTGAIQYVASFPKLTTKNALNKGIEIVFNSPENKTKKLYYYSLNLADGGLKTNRGMLNYLQKMGTINTYLKGASYLMHEKYFSLVRNVILNQSQFVIQDDSGIAFKYFGENGKWNYKFYGQYIKPISLFSYAYQKDLDSAYKQLGSKPIGFGIGYNFKDKNSNFMIAEKVK